MGRIAAAVLTLVLLQPSLALSESYPRRGLQQLRLSPDGHYILAQTDFRIAVLTVQPLSVLLQIPAAFASPSNFTPDSQEIVFLNSAQNAPMQPFVSYVERWSIAERKRVSHTAISDQTCRSEDLSPDGNFLACVDAKGTLRLIDVASTGTIFEKKRFGQLFMWVGTCREFNSTVNASCIPANESGNPGSATFHFSPDGRFAVAMQENSRGAPLAFDLRERRVVRMTGELRRFDAFTFVAPNRAVISRSGKNIQINRLVAFPSGEDLSKAARLPAGPLSLAADHGFILIRTFVGRAVDYRSGQVIANDTPALDVFRNFYVAELANGEVGLYDRDKGLQAVLALPGR